MENRVSFLRASGRSRCAVFVIASAVIALSTTNVRAQFVPGIDVSRHQGGIDWNAVKNSGVQFAFAKATEGVDFVDIRFHTNMQGARAAGVYIGPYHFCRAESKNGVPFTSYDGLPFVPGSNPYEDAVSEANDFLEAIVPYYHTGQHLPPVADVERFPNFGSFALNRAFVSNWVQLFSDTVYSAMGVRPIIYTGLTSANTYFNAEVAAGHDLWLAWWRGTGTSDPPQQGHTPLWNPWRFWQWTDSWSVPGISGAVDGDVFNGSLPELQNLLLGNDGAEGDFNRDGLVDSADYVVWRKTLGQTVPMYTGADADGDARVDADDVVSWRTAFGLAGTSGPGRGLTATPEPHGAMLVIVGAWAAFACRSRRKGCRASSALR